MLCRCITQANTMRRFLFRFIIHVYTIRDFSYHFISQVYTLQQFSSHIIVQGLFFFIPSHFVGKYSVACFRSSQHTGEHNATSFYHITKQDQFSSVP